MEKPVINAELCTGCEVCIDECPNNCLEILPFRGNHYGGGVSNLRQRDEEKGKPGDKCWQGENWRQ